jgi:hypothetical protein
VSRSRTGAVALAGAGAAALFATIVALSPTASADPAALPSPALPGIDVLRQLASVAGIPQALQTTASALSGTPAASQTAPSPLASASVSVPNPLPGAAAPQNGLTGALPAAASPLAASPLATNPLAASPLSLPTDLTSLMSSLGSMTGAAAGAPGAPPSLVSALP